MSDETYDLDVADDAEFLRNFDNAAAAASLPNGEEAAGDSSTINDQPVETDVSEQSSINEDTPNTDTADEIDVDVEETQDTDEHDGETETDEQEVLDEEPSATDVDEKPNDVDYAAEFERLTAPLKANGKDVVIDNVEDIRNLVSKGLGFSKKMQLLKPHLKIIKSLKDNGLLDQEKLNHLIDITKGDKAAIAKLMQDTGVDPLTALDADGTEYKPNSYEVSDNAYALDEAINSIKSSETFNKSMAVMGEEWDDKSRDIIAEHPEVVGIIDEHINSGVYDVVSAFVTKERALGRLDNVPDVDAYHAAVLELNRQGVLTSNTGVSPNKPNIASDENPLKPAAKKAAAIKNKRKAAGGTKKTAHVPGNPLDASDSLSDDEFLKLFDAS